jgi:predicted permease
MEPRLTGFTNERSLQLYRDVADRAARIPRVSAVAVATHVPLARAAMLPWSAGAGGVTTSDGKPVKVTAGLASVTPGYFDVLGVPLVSGRAFTAADDGDADRVVILNESAAREFFANAPPLGRQIRLFGPKGYTVVGVVRDTKYQSVRDEAVPFIFAPLEQEPGVGGVSVLVRSSAPTAALPALRAALHEADPSVPLRDARLVARQIDRVLMPQRFGAVLFTVFGLVALAITAVGIYGTVAYTVSQRTTEIGIRSALGAQRGHIVRLVLRRTGIALGSGTLAGGAVALAGTRAAEHFLYGVAPTDPSAFAAAGVLLVATTLVVALGPARRAARIEPSTALRAE